MAGNKFSGVAAEASYKLWPRSGGSEHRTSMDWRQISELRKSGRLDEAYVTAQRLLDGGNEDVRVRQAMGWVLYERAREVVRSEGEALTPGEQRRLQAIVAELVSLDLPKADMLHSRLLALIVRKRGGDE